MKILAKVKYLGTSYKGWQKQINDPTIQEEIEKVLSKILDTPITIYGSGRTDAGVHALGQYFHFIIDKNIDLDKFRYSVNMLLPKDIHIISFEEVDEDFHARFNAKKKCYQYHFYIGEEDPFKKDISTFYPYPFDIDIFKKSLSLFIGKHDYRNFTSKEEDESNFIREIFDINLVNDKDEYIITFMGDGFMRYMIRDIVGTCFAISSGKQDISYIKKRLDNPKRDITSFKAKAEGLYLIDVIY